jgi:ABC-2 type transport system permease protein
MSMARTARAIYAVAARDVRSAFVTPTGWIVLALAGTVAVLAFASSSFDEARPATLRSVMLAFGWTLLATAPALSMRSFSEEFRLKTWETLFASPLSAAALVLAKALACAVLVAATLAPVALLAVPLELYSAPDYGEIGCGLLGLFLAGLAVASIGIAVSTTTASQTVAFLGAFFVWLGLVAGSRILTGVLPVEWAPVAAACDPLRRLEGFALGLFDTGAVAYFAGITVVSLVAGVVSLERLRDRPARTRLGRAMLGLEGALFVVATLAATVACTALLSTPALRIEADATKTRAYSLAPSTETLLGSLEGAWSVLLFVDAAKADKAVLRQIDEVLERFGEANPSIDARRIDPSDPSSSGAFEQALSKLVSSRAGDLARIEQEVARGLAVFQSFRSESASQPAGLRAAAQQLPADSATRRTIEQVAAMFAQVATDGEQFRAKVVELTKTSAARPLPDLEGARSALAQGFRVWGDQLASAATLFADWRGEATIPAPVRSVLSARIAPFESLATRMAESRQALEALPALEIDQLGRALVEGEAAVVAGGGRLAVIPAWRIFPRSLAVEGEGRVSYSWSFRGEEVLAGAIRSLSAGSMPEVVFVHGERDSLLRAKQDHSDLTAVADSLRSAGFGVSEWTPGRGERPAKTAGRTQVFVVLPALRRGQLDLSREEKLLVAEARQLVAEGAPVLVTAGRSMLQVLGQPDPWKDLLAPFGIDADAARVVLELSAGEDGAPTVVPWQLIDEAPPPSAVAPRIRGRAVLFNQPMRVVVQDPLPTGVTVVPAVEVAPSAERWLADDWRGDGDGVREVPAAKRFAEPLPVAVLAERRSAAESQRAALVASGGWMLTSVADLSEDLGGGRTALQNPGNRELLLALVSWLAGREDLLDAGLSGREVARVEGLDGRARLAWIVALLAVLGAGPLAGGAVVVARRRGRA